MHDMDVRNDCILLTAVTYYSWSVLLAHILLTSARLDYVRGGIWGLLRPDLHKVLYSRWERVAVVIPLVIFQSHGLLFSYASCKCIESYHQTNFIQMWTGEFMLFFALNVRPGNKFYLKQEPHTLINTITVATYPFYSFLNCYLPVERSEKRTLWLFLRPCKEEAARCRTSRDRIWEPPYWNNKLLSSRCTF